MADVDINKFRASVVREGSKPASPGFIVSEGQSPTDPAGSGQNHLPVTIAEAATGLSITESQVLGGAGTVGQYIRGDGSLADFPESSGGGSSVSYYLNGSVAQGTIGGVAYKELNKVPILGAGTDFTINANGYIASFLTDAGDPNLLEIPGGNWNFETYFSANNGGGSPTFYVELYKYNGTTFTLLASNSAIPELIAFGTNITAYFTTLAVPTTTLALTDRLAVRYYVTHSNRTITMHTEGPHLCQIITTFTTGLTALNGLTAQVQNFAVGTSGTDFNIASATATHTFNLPDASATARGVVSTGTQIIAGAKTFNSSVTANSLIKTGGTSSQFLKADGSVDSSTYLTTGTAASTYVPYTGATQDVDLGIRGLTANGIVTFSIYANGAGTNAGQIYFKHNSVFSLPSGYGSIGSGNSNEFKLYQVTNLGVFRGATLSLNGITASETRNFAFPDASGTIALVGGAGVGTVTSVGLSSATSGVTIGSTPVTTSGTITLAIATASGSQNGLLSSTDWTTFNSKQNALTNPVTGTGTTNYLPKFTGSTTIGNSQIFDNGTNVGIGTNIPSTKLFIRDSASANPSIFVLEGFDSGRGLEIKLSADGLGANGSAVIYNTRVGAPYGEHIWQQAGTQRMRLDTSGNLGLGVTPSAWSLFTVIEGVSGTALAYRTNAIEIFNNAIYDGTNFNFVNTGLGANRQNVSDGFFRFYVSPSGTAGNAITFTQAMTLTPGGNLILTTGTVSDNGARLQVSGSASFDNNANSAQQLIVRNTTAGSSSETYLYLISDGSAGSATVGKFSSSTNSYKILTASNGYLYNGTAGDIAILNDVASGAIKMAAGGSSTAQFTLTSSGNVLIGTPTNGASKLRIVGLPTSAAGLSSGDLWNDSGTLKIA